MSDWEIRQGDVMDRLREMPDGSVQCCVTSPPYWGLRDYGVDGQIGLEPTPEAFIERMVGVFREVRRVLRDDGTCWVNLGDSYANAGSGGGASNSGHDGDIDGKHTNFRDSRYLGQGNPKITGNGLKTKDLCGVPWRVALALQADGWYLRSDIIWSKPNPMPESVTDRPTKAHEYVFLLTKSQRYFYDAEGVKDKSTKSLDALCGKKFDRTVGNTNGLGNSTLGPGRASGRNLRSVWHIPTQPFTGWTRTYHLDPVEPGGASDDKMRITSADCPSHAGFLDRVPKAFRDEHATEPLTRILRKHGRPVPRLESDSDLSGWLHEHCCEADSSDSMARSCFETASDRSNQSHKTGHETSTTPSYNACEQIDSRIDDRSIEPALPELHHDTAENNTSADSASNEKAIDPSGENNPCTKDKCTCFYYSITTKEISHFATYPQKLVEPCVKAGTSEKGCCPQCGAPWVRVVERKPMVLDRSDRTHPMGRTRTSGTMIEPPISQTTGWRPGCGCGNCDDEDLGGEGCTNTPLEPQPCTVLDPFCGSGTTGAVACLLGRRFIGIELNPEYAKLAEKRIAKAVRPNTYRDMDNHDGPLFEGVGI